jgi:hypothetical protein
MVSPGYKEIIHNPDDARKVARGILGKRKADAFFKSLEHIRSVRSDYNTSKFDRESILGFEVHGFLTGKIAKGENGDCLKPSHLREMNFSIRTFFGKMSSSLDFPSSKMENGKESAKTTYSEYKKYNRNFSKLLDCALVVCPPLPQNNSGSATRQHFPDSGQKKIETAIKKIQKFYPTALGANLLGNPASGVERKMSVDILNQNLAKFFFSQCVNGNIGEEYTFSPPVGGEVLFYLGPQLRATKDEKQPRFSFKIDILSEHGPAITYSSSLGTVKSKPMENLSQSIEEIRKFLFFEQREPLAKFEVFVRVSFGEFFKKFSVKLEESEKALNKLEEKLNEARKIHI